MDDRLAEEIRGRLTAIVAALPGAEAGPPMNGHSKFTVRGKSMAYYLVDHHGDGRLALACKATPGMQDALVQADPARFFVPAYLGPGGWVGVDLGGDIDWGHVEELLREAYRLQAPKRLVRELDGG
jgi:hypothetical protein